LTKKKAKSSRVCRCGKPGTYRYSYELSQWLGLLTHEGVFLCDDCLEEMDLEWRKEHGHEIVDH
jgi:hypothetical protein